MSGWLLTLKQITKFVFVRSLLQNINFARRSKAGRETVLCGTRIDNRMIYVNYVRHRRLFPFAFGAKQLIFPPSSDAANAQKNLTY